MRQRTVNRLMAWKFWAIFVFASALGPAQAAQVSVAVAANVAGAMQKVAVAFAEDTGHQAVLSIGSTGKFYAQIRNGAPFQVLLAADDETPWRLEKEGFAVAGTRFTYAIGRLALWSPQPGVVDERGDVLRANRNDKLAIADPKLAPYGAAALQTLTRLNLLAHWQPRLVQGENIGQAWQFVATGNAALGFVALSQVWVDGRLNQGSMWLVPAELHDSLRQDAVLLPPGRDAPAARAFLTYLQGERARAILRAHGYTF